MTDLLFSSPLHFVEGCIFIWQWLGTWVPHYSWAEYASLAKGFIWLIPLRVAYGIAFPEKVIVKQGRRYFYRKRGVKPSKTDHQTASAAIYEILKH